MKKLSLLLVLACASLMVRAQVPAAMALADTLQTLLDARRAEFGINGFSAAVVFPDGSRWTGVSGIDEAMQPLTDSSLFFANYSTEAHLAALTLLLHQEGTIDINKRYIRYHAPIAFVDTHITIRQLLRHRSGLYNFTNNPDWPNASSAHGPTYVYSSEECLDNWLDHSGSAPGLAFQRYNFSDYTILALVIEAVTGEPIYETLRARIWEPLNLTHTFWYGDETYTLPPPGGFVQLDSAGPFYSYAATPKLPFMTSLGANCRVVTTPADAARFIDALLIGQVIDSNTLAMMQTPEPLSTTDPQFSMGLEVHVLPNGVHNWGTFGGGLQFLGNILMTFRNDGYQPTISVASNTYSLIQEQYYYLLNAYVFMDFGAVYDAYLEDVAVQQPFASALPITLWPNPCKGSTTVLFEQPVGATPLEITVFSPTGQLVHRQWLDTGQQQATIPVPGPAGLYSIRVRQGQATTARIIVKIE